ncbi:hypothetical protein CEXT_625671 [Caerostris extrusa]|uniref:Uncharacterized protein n=1 Tax=Caerostris extrusa TaxID=172846 RepID=A0AAV4N2E5_CAEEX|nr:hypothetical protein CEXT_625671 [Caerostris extrusa]
MVDISRNMWDCSVLVNSSLSLSIKSAWHENKEAINNFYVYREGIDHSMKNRVIKRDLYKIRQAMPNRNLFRLWRREGSSVLGMKLDK